MFNDPHVFVRARHRLIAPPASQPRRTYDSRHELGGIRQRREPRRPLA
jgi:hypothetical protein